MVLRQDIYVFDQSTTCLFKLVPQGSTTESLHVRTLVPDGLQRESTPQVVWQGWLGIIHSLTKLVELVILSMHLCALAGNWPLAGILCLIKGT